MVSKELLRHLVRQQKTRIDQKDDSVHRNILDQVLNSFEDNRVIILTGIRRCGKSTLLKQIMQTKIHYCYVNFEDERLLTFPAEEFEILNEVLIEVYGPSDIFFFDEIQNIAGFETFVRRLQDEGKKIVITGSNASLLSREFGTRLTGRYKLFEIFPFSFAEYLCFQKVNVRKDSLYIPYERVTLITTFAKYVENGGMPEYLIHHDPEYIKTLYDNILYRDIIARYAIRRQRLIRELVGILISNLSLPVTYNSLKKTLGLTNAITVKEYITYLHSAYLFFELSRFDYSVKKQLNSPKKCYCIDTAFGILGGFSLSPNKGRLLENIVYVELLRRGTEVYYFQEKRECDFITKDGPQITGALQVCFELTNENRDREIGGVLEAIEFFGLKEGFILTNDEEDLLVMGEVRIIIMPVWRWLLNYIPD